MTPGSRWRLALAHRLAPYFTAHPQIRALVVGGSVCRGFADEYADLELGVYWQKAPSETDRRAIHQTLQARADLFETFPAAEADQGQGADEDIYLWGDRSSGFQVDIKHRSIATTQRLLEQGESETQGVIREVIPLYGQDLIQQWKAQIPSDSDEQVRRDVYQQLDYLPRWLAPNWARQGEYLPLAQHQSAVFFALCGALTRLNRQHLPFVKYTARTMAELEIKPPHYWTRTLALLEQPLEARAAVLQQLVDDTFTLVQRHLPDLDTAPILARIFRPHGQLLQGPVEQTAWPPEQRHLLDQLTRNLGDLPLQGALLSGATSRRQLGRYVDWEITLVWPGPPNAQAACQAMESLGGQNLQKDQDGRRQGWRCGTIDIDLCHAELEDLTGSCSPEMQPLIATLRQGTPLYGQQWHRAWCSAIPPIATEQIGPTIDAVLGQIEWAWSNRIDVYAHRQGLPFFFGLLCYQVEALVRLLLALNKRPLIHPGNGDALVPHLQHLERAPADFGGRLEEVFHSSPVDAVTLHRQLLEETFELLAQHAPQTNWQAAQQSFRRLRRKAWVDPPANWQM
ncbi:MAG: hypothetical protein GKR89_34635 [Candidatus Latescibacteria bacterium]|nr:hypothetical protein [Candidatus Latescibacterota bacterium]